MGEICGWHMKAAGTKEGIVAFERMLYAAELNGKGPDGYSASPENYDKLRDYEYARSETFLLNERTAIGLMDRCYPILKLRDNGITEPAEDVEDIRRHTKTGGLCGIRTDNLFRTSMPEIRGAAYGTYPDIKAIEDSGNGTYTIEAWGSSRDSLEPMIEGKCEENEILLQEAARRAGVTVEVFGDAYSGLSGMDFHLLIGPDGTILKNITADSIHEWLDNYADDEELVEAARPVLRSLGKELPEDVDEAREALNEYIDKEGYVDIRPFEWKFGI